MLLVEKQKQKRMRTLIKKQALDTRTCSPGAGDRGRTGTVSPPPDFESGTSANSITPAGIPNASIIHDIIPKIKIIFRAGDLFQHSARKLTFLCKLWQKRNAFC